MREAAINRGKPEPSWTPDQELKQAVSQFCEDRQLTPREKQIVCLLCTGMKNAAIADELQVSEATVRLHITNIHRKLQTSSKVDVLLQAFQYWISRSRERRSRS
ncbi:MAG TPA: LuxR C-terminal-related transcriptional regulator [Phycisphaerae bacterium]|nr:LuxR C-terminal-related transcriptional regulator [Phycisphaerae bacterium]HOJ74737.1 LuxR C-terminal-related transcriptional regulator [Phycisphaerae bacterium]HOM52106.1 LuxR C-terminal-related transcriptional regulator [Phycisphaerae bacterium]HON68130.1 LuxR C-terminal-related transcriptional regulator [Phycisphaerae bacterium]HOQ87239.1 LuxR C-terminal-related transcriptional regulator [Phycisphaerae bacterium]